MEIKQYNTALPVDGRRAGIVEVLAHDTFIADIGSSPKDWAILTRWARLAGRQK